MVPMAAPPHSSTWQACLRGSPGASEGPVLGASGQAASEAQRLPNLDLHTDPDQQELLPLHMVETP